MERTLQGAMTGAVGGLIAGVLGELTVGLVSRLLPTDVLIVGFALVWAVPLGALVGAISGWRGWFPDRRRRGAVAAIPGLAAGAIAALLQASAV